ncbi:MAG TPA: Calx-beta domain-containing protein, partial [Blastocatellia bacterium]|nr:Calx-beta domain-containing protein [Blastocatellia bacterium]
MLSIVLAMMLGTVLSGLPYLPFSITGRSLASNAKSMMSAQSLPTVSINDAPVTEGDPGTTNMSLTEILSAASILPAQTQSTLSISDVSVTEGDSGTVTAVFTVTLSFSGFRDWTTAVDYTTADGTATIADNDYSSRSGTLIFGLGTGSATTTISVPITGDTRSEGNETFVINLSNARTNPAGAVRIDDGQGVCTIVDNDATVRPTLSINDVSVTEGNAGTVDVVF